MNHWMIGEIHNLPITLCGAFYSILCIFSLITGLLYATGKRKLNPIELSKEFVKKLDEKNQREKFAKIMGWVTIFVGIIQGLTALAIFKGYNPFLNLFSISFTVFSIVSVIFKLFQKKNLFSIIKLFFYILILLILLLNGIHNYGATKGMQYYLKSNKEISVTNIKEGYYFKKNKNKKAIIFFPGARIQYTAYSKLMNQLTSNGYDCFLLANPINLAFFNANTPTKIINHYKYKNWYIAGHSLGGVIGAQYASKNPKKIKGIIMLASYPIKKIPNNVEYISIYGNQDKILNRKKLEESKKYLPKGYYMYEINGGNHANFANYGNQKGDGKASISIEKQQKKGIELILRSFK